MTCSYSKEFSLSSYTNIENTFITQYLPSSTGDAVKVYIFGLYLCQNPNRDVPIEDVASTLSMPIEKVIDCFTYWEEFGLVSIISKEPFSVVYMPIKEVFSGKPRKYKAEKYEEFSKGLQALLPSRMISTSEFTEYFSIMETYSIKPEAMLMIVRYCADRKGKDISYRYISKVAKDFGDRGIITIEKVENELASYLLRTNELERIFKALSIRRQPDIEDLNLLKKWTGELSFETDNVIFAAKKLKKGNMERLDKFLFELYSVKCFSKEEITDYIDKKQYLFDLAIKINRALSIYVEVLDPEVNTYITKWLSYGFSEETLLLIASRCFNTGKKTLQDMDELLQTLREDGFIELSSVHDYFQAERKTDEFLSKMLITCGISRRPTQSDRNNLNMWKNWNLSEEMIMEAAKISSGKSSPFAYMSGILSNWKNQGIFTLENAISSEIAVTDTTTQEDYNREYERRRSIAISRAQKNVDNAMKIDGFSTIYERLFAIEKDLAFAEISGDVEKLKTLENEKKELIIKQAKLLEQINLTEKDLTPNFQCEKCKDTGYIGTHRCDCF